MDTIPMGGRLKMIVRTTIIVDISYPEDYKSRNIMKDGLFDAINVLDSKEIKGKQLGINVNATVINK